MCKIGYSCSFSGVYNYLHSDVLYSVIVQNTTIILRSGHLW